MSICRGFPTLSAQRAGLVEEKPSSRILRLRLKLYPPKDALPHFGHRFWPVICVECEVWNETLSHEKVPRFPIPNKSLGIGQEIFQETRGSHDGVNVLKG